MSKSNWIPLLLSLVLATFVAWLGNAWIEQRYGAQEKPPDMVKVLVAAKDIPIDTKIDQTHLKVVEMPPASAPAGHLTTADQILGKRLKEPVYNGEAILSRRLLDDSAASMLSVTLTPGKRAVAVRVDDIIGVSGFILPGSHVDVISSSGGQAQTVLQDIKVLTVGQTMTAEGGTLKAGSVTLEVDPRQAEILLQTTERGSIRLALRHQLDRGYVELPGAAPAPLGPEIGALETPPAATPSPRSPPPLSVIVIKGMLQTVAGLESPHHPAASLDNAEEGE